SSSARPRRWTPRPGVNRIAARIPGASGRPPTIGSCRARSSRSSSRAMCSFSIPSGGAIPEGGRRGGGAGGGGGAPEKRGGRTGAGSSIQEEPGVRVDVAGLRVGAVADRRALATALQVGVRTGSTEDDPAERLGRRREVEMDLDLDEERPPCAS